ASSGVCTFTGTWLDMLRDKDGSIRYITDVVGADSTIEEEPTPMPVVTTPTSKMTQSPTPTSEVPGFEPIFAVVSLLIAYLFVFRGKGSDSE
ncbi:hypothetical protein C5S29_04570, partial [ANME-1 cluster archaeon GoMg3.2]|nr:hypothetical protein [ANME-1 cluster archaeon GoMg3.2]